MSRKGGDGQLRWRGLMARHWLEDQVVPYSCTDKLGGKTGERDRPHNPGFQHREIKPQNLWLKKTVGVKVVGEIPSLTGEFVGETHKVLESTQNHPPRDQHQKGPICLWVAGEVTKSQSRAKQAALFPLRTLPHIQRHNRASPCQIPKAPPPTV